MDLWVAKVAVEVIGGYRGLGEPPWLGLSGGTTGAGWFLEALAG